ncbi:MAG: hypothetical protein P4L50_07775, partial [Anaerolineaceae bacterium]|nr:hypothetical protein [Anaerolineaceae bacterium]
GIAGLACYTLVLVEARYIGPFVLLVILGFFPCILIQKPGRSGKPSAFVTAIVAGFMMLVTTSFVVLHLAVPLPILRGYGGLHYQTAQSLNADGLQPGQAVAIIGSGWDAMVWARLARVRIVAQIPQEDSKDFWSSSDPGTKEAVYDAIAKSGAKAIVTEETVPSIGFADWQRIGDTPYHVHFLHPSTNESISKSAL